MKTPDLHLARLLRTAFALAALVAWLPALAQGTDPAATRIPPSVVAAVRALVPAVQADSIRPGPAPGLYQATEGPHLLIVTANGRYVMDGQVFDLARGLDLSRAVANHWRLTLLRRLPPHGAIVFRAPDPRFAVTVFTDPSCTYCQLIAAHLSQYLAAGITLRFVADPELLGIQHGNPVLARIWCASDRQQAYRAAFVMHVVPPAVHACTAVLAGDESVAKALRLPGLPALIGPHGSILGGYLSPRALTSKLALDAATP